MLDDMTPDEAVELFFEKGLVAEIPTVKSAGIVLIGGRTRDEPRGNRTFPVYHGGFHIKIEDLGDDQDGEPTYSYLARFPAPTGLHLTEVRHTSLDHAVKNILVNVKPAKSR